MRMGKLLTFYFSDEELKWMVEKYLRDDLGRPDWASHLVKNDCMIEFNKSDELVVSIDGEFEEKGLQKLRGLVTDGVPKKVLDTIEDAGKLAIEIAGTAVKAAASQKGKKKRFT